MRFQHSPNGTTRTRRFFAFIPVRIKLETRWMEMVRIKKLYHRTKTGLSAWKKIGFLDGDR